MAIIKQGIMGPLSGRIGPVVGCILKNGTCYLRMRPQNYQDAKTREQLKNRFKLSLNMSFMTKAKEFARMNMDRAASELRMSGVNLVLSWNYQRMSTVDEDARSGIIHYDKIVMSDGPVGGVIGQMALRTEEGIVLAWHDNSGAVRCNPDDLMRVMVYDERLGEALSFYDVARRDSAGCFLALPEGWLGDRLHLWLVFRNGLHEVSMSGYCLFDGLACGDSLAGDLRRAVSGADSGVDFSDLGFGNRGFVGFESEQSATKENARCYPNWIGGDFDKGTDLGFSALEMGVKPPE